MTAPSTEATASQEGPASGPYATEADVFAEVRDIYAGHAKRGVMRARNLDLLLRACAEHGVELGDYDRAVLRRVAAGPPETAQVIASLIARAALPAAEVREHNDA
ncbi:hypothetical protein [Actinomadura verrucosospora]|uniref:Uncharacterized protein n=1 Tax=Actinomadura verrucosospora TaxID=46165 RepID=A0A7D4AWD0_ACTVE|nr:hypothetical protein [Actinomadura verrucosospora]QKG26689.1 hypothetical protein ACTIVE_8342 [Actinomadura verrucosospora]